MKIKILVHITSKKNIVHIDALSYMDVLVNMARKYGDNFKAKGLTIGLVLADHEVIRGCEIARLIG